jgi:transcriptional regulator with XRE-family HTH domain
MIFRRIKPMELHEKIKILRKRRNYLQKELADLIGLTEQSYARIENGKNKDFHIARLEQIAAVLETKPYILMDNTTSALTLDEWLNLARYTTKGNENKDSENKDSENKDKESKDKENIENLYREIDNLKERLAASIKKQQLQEQLLKTYQSILKDYLSTSKTIEVWNETYAKELIRISQEKDDRLREANELLEMYEKIENPEQIKNEEVGNQEKEEFI